MPQEPFYLLQQVRDESSFRVFLAALAAMFAATIALVAGFERLRTRK